MNFVPASFVLITTVKSNEKSLLTTDTDSEFDTAHKTKTSNKNLKFTSTPCVCCPWYETNVTDKTDANQWQLAFD